MGADKIPIPNKYATDADWNLVYEKLGKPKIGSLRGMDDETSNSMRRLFGQRASDFCRGYMRGY